MKPEALCPTEKPPVDRFAAGIFRDLCAWEEAHKGDDGVYKRIDEQAFHGLVVLFAANGYWRILQGVVVPQVRGASLKLKETPQQPEPVDFDKMLKDFKRAQRAACETCCLLQLEAVKRVLGQKIPLKVPPNPPVADEVAQGQAPCLAHAANRPLTKCELNVLRLVAQGKTSVEMAEIIGRRRHTIDVHCTSIMSKLGLSKRKELRDYVAKNATTLVSTEPTMT